MTKASVNVNVPALQQPRRQTVTPKPASEEVQPVHAQSDVRNRMSHSIHNKSCHALAYSNTTATVLQSLPQQRRSQTVVPILTGMLVPGSEANGQPTMHHQHGPAKPAAAPPPPVQARSPAIVQAYPLASPYSPPTLFSPAPLGLYLASDGRRKC
jgi:hypothetical protein